MVTLIFVTGSVQVEVAVVVVEEVAVEEVEVVVVVVHVMAVLAGAAPQEVRPSKTPSKTNTKRPFSAPRSSWLEICDACGRTSVLVPTIPNPISRLKSCFLYLCYAQEGRLRPTQRTERMR